VIDVVTAAISPDEVQNLPLASFGSTRCVLMKVGLHGSQPARRSQLASLPLLFYDRRFARRIFQLHSSNPILPMPGTHRIDISAIKKAAVESWNGHVILVAFSPANPECRFGTWLFIRPQPGARSVSRISLDGAYPKI